MSTIRQILEKKGATVATIGPDETVYRALELMADADIGALVVAEGDHLVGMFSERDYARRVILKGRSSLDTPVKDIMVKQVITAAPDDTVDACLGIMTEKRIRHLPIIENDKLVGLVSIGDLVKSVIDQQQSTIDQLVTYVSGGA